jgi:hypothetical protein
MRHSSAGRGLRPKETNVISCDGTLEHNDHYLEPEDKASGRKIMICVSRLKGQEIVLDL